MAPRLAASCPSCGAPVALDAGETALRCERCGSAHLALHGGGTTVARLSERTSAEEAAGLARAALADEMRRRERRGPEPAVEEVVAFEAPVRVLVARLHEAAVVRGAAGDPEAAVTARVAGHAATALRDPLGLATMPEPGEVDPRGLAVVSPRSIAAPPFDVGDDAFAADAARLGAACAGGAPRLARHAVSFPLARLVVLRPCRLVAVSSGRSRGAVLVDGAAREATALLSRPAYEALRAEVADRPLPAAPPPALRPMRCPECASPLPLDREGQLRFCPACRRAFLAAGRRLVPLAYRAELPPSPRGRLLLPAWRIPFALVDPRDGREVSSVAEVLARCGDDTARGGGAPGTLDVPAVLPADRRREQRGTQRLPSLPPAAFPFFEGPARSEAGFPDPRPAGALGPSEAAAVVRHALLAALAPAAVARASARRLKAFLFDAPLRTGRATLVLRAVPRADLESV